MPLAYVCKKDKLCCLNVTLILNDLAAFKFHATFGISCSSQTFMYFLMLQKNGHYYKINVLQINYKYAQFNCAATCLYDTLTAIRPWLE